MHNKTTMSTLTCSWNTPFRKRIIGQQCCVNGSNGSAIQETARNQIIRNLKQSGSMTVHLLGMWLIKGLSPWQRNKIKKSMWEIYGLFWFFYFSKWRFKHCLNIYPSVLSLMQHAVTFKLSALTPTHKFIHTCTSTYTHTQINWQENGDCALFVVCVFLSMTALRSFYQDMGGFALAAKNKDLAKHVLAKNKPLTEISWKVPEFTRLIQDPP